MSVLVTGAGGYVGSLTVDALVDGQDVEHHVVALDVREVPPARRREGVTYATEDIRSPELADLLTAHDVRTVVHLAAIVEPGDMSEQEQYDIDVGGTRNVAEACVKADVEQLVVTSSGAAYGYHADNPRPLVESDPVRGHEEFTYARHKRLVEELLAEYRETHPSLGQLVLRPGTILGEGTDNQITNLFDGRVVLGLSGTDVPFVFIWDVDVAEIIARGVRERRTGIYNLAGDDTLTLREIARLQNRPFVPLPAGLVTAGLTILGRLGVGRYGPEQVDFLRYRPVLDNSALKRDFPGLPRLTTREVFDLWRGVDVAPPATRKAPR